MMPTIKFVKEKKTIEVPPGSNLRSEAMKNGVELYPGMHRVFNCHGLGQCAGCRVVIKKGKENVSRQGFLEKLRFWLGPLTFFVRLDHDDDVRLACKMKVNGDVEVETQPPLNWHGEQFWG